MGLCKMAGFSKTVVFSGGMAGLRCLKQEEADIVPLAAATSVDDDGDYSENNNNVDQTMIIKSTTNEFWLLYCFILL